MLRVLKSHSAAERIAAAVEFIRSFPPATELLIIGASRDAVDDFVRGLARSVQATFGLHRFSLTQHRPSTVLKASAELRALYCLMPKADEPDTVPGVDDGDKSYVVPCDRCGAICDGDSRLCADCEKSYQATAPTFHAGC